MPWDWVCPQDASAGRFFRLALDMEISSPGGQSQACSHQVKDEDASGQSKPESFPDPPCLVLGYSNWEQAKSSKKGGNGRPKKVRNRQLKSGRKQAIRQENDRGAFCASFFGHVRWPFSCVNLGFPIIRFTLCERMLASLVLEP